MSKTYHIFISHSWAYPDAYEGLIKLLDKDPNFSYSDYSVPQNDPIHNAGTSKELYNAIKAQVSKASVVIIMAGVYSIYSKWINKEIEIAQTEFLIPKPINQSGNHVRQVLKNRESGLLRTFSDQ